MAIAKSGSSATASSGSTAVSSQSITLAPAAGTTVVVFAAGHASGVTFTCASVGASASFTREVSLSAAAGVLAIFVATNVPSGITSLTLTPSSSTQVLGWACAYTGVDNTTPMQVTPTSTDPSPTSTAQTTMPITPTVSGALVLAGMAWAARSSTSSPFKGTTAGPTNHSGDNAGTGWTAEMDLWNQGASSTSVDITVASNGCNTTSGAYAANYTLAVSYGCAQGTIALNPAGAGPTIPPNLFFTMF